MTPQPDDRRHLVRVGSLLIVVLGALLLGALLRQDEPGGPSRPVVQGEEAAAVIEREVKPDESTRVPPSATGATGDANDAADRPRPAATPLSDLAQRATTDFARLPDGEAWLLQLAAICDADSVSRLTAQVDDAELYVLPVEIGDRACFRICWGPFDSRAAALGATDGLPGSIRALSDSPQPRPVSSLIP